MTKKIIALAIVALIAMGALYSCKTAAAPTAVSYELANNYFIRNDVQGEPPTVITTQEEFDRNFSMAAYMGENGQPSAIDFSKQNAICVSVPATYAATRLSVDSIQRVGDSLLVQYTVTRGRKQHFSTHPFLLLVVDKKLGTNVRLEEVPPQLNLIIYYDPEVGSKPLLDAAKKFGSKVLYEYANLNSIAVSIPRSKTFGDAMAYYSKVPGYLSASPDEMLHLD